MENEQSDERNVGVHGFSVSIPLGLIHSQVLEVVIDSSTCSTIESWGEYLQLRRYISNKHHVKTLRARQCKKEGTEEKKENHLIKRKKVNMQNYPKDLTNNRRTKYISQFYMPCISKKKKQTNKLRSHPNWYNSDNNKETKIDHGVYKTLKQRKPLDQ